MRVFKILLGTLASTLKSEAMTQLRGENLVKVRTKLPALVKRPRGQGQRQAHLLGGSYNNPGDN